MNGLDMIEIEVVAWSSQQALPDGESIASLANITEKAMNLVLFTVDC